MARNKSGKQPPAPIYDRKTAIKYKPGVKVQFIHPTLTLVIPNALQGNPSATQIQTRIQAYCALKKFELGTMVKFSWEDSRKGTDTSQEMTIVTLFNAGTIGARIVSSIQDKMEELLEERNDRLDRDEEPIVSTHLQFKIHTLDLIWVIKEVWSVKDKVLGNEKWATAYTSQGIAEYRSTRKDIMLILYLETEPYMAILPAAMFKPLRV